jgi:hypothetical protein
MTNTLVGPIQAPIDRGTQRAAARERANALQKVYKIQKFDGTRNTNGTQKLKKLKAKHKLIIAMHLEGVSNQKIAEALNISYANVWLTLQDPLAEKLIEEWHKGLDLELKALRVLAVDAVRRGLNSGDVEVALKAAMTYNKFPGVAPEEKPPEVNIVNEVRIGVINKLRTIAGESGVIISGNATPTEKVVVQDTE